MADSNLNTGACAPIPAADALAALAGAYDALAVLALAHEGDNSPTVLLLTELNGRFRALLDDLDAAGVLS